MLFHFWWTFNTDSCDLTLVIFIFSFSSFLYRSLSSGFLVFFVIDIVSGCTGLFLLFLLFLLFFVIYVSIRVLFIFVLLILWLMVVSWGFGVQY